MKNWARAACCAAMLAGLFPGIVAAKGGEDPKMRALTPDTRMEQRCNARAMGEVSRSHRDMRPDELVAYAFANTVIKGDTIKAPGAAVRSRDKWYHLSYTCETKDQGMDIKSFQYSLGDAVPEAEWPDHYLVH